MNTVSRSGDSAISERISPVVATSPVGRRRRPSGEPPPLPRRIERSTRWYLLLAALTGSFWIAVIWTPLLPAVTRADMAVLRALGNLHTSALTRAARGLAAIGGPWSIRALAWATIAVLIAFRRIQRLGIYLVLWLLLALLDTTVALVIGRSRPLGVPILGHWSGYAHPARPVAQFAFVLVAALYTLVPEGRWRDRGKAVAGSLVAAVSVAALYLDVSHPTDIIAALTVGWAVPVVVFRLFTPDEAFPVSYGGRRRAHLDVGGARRTAIISALDQQLGLDALDIEPFGLEGSAGSTPLRVRVRDHDGTESVLFAKLYAVNHLRSDRWYKMVRTVLYGRLEDEKPFSSVRRLVEYEDHLLRLLRDAGLPTPKPYGFVEITPEREYLIVMEFVAGATEIGKATVDEAVIDDALATIRRLWDAGVAHRDIKPSNVLAGQGRVHLIDVAFATVRPSPWRQAVDLANMMLTLALPTSAELVYERALLLFAPEDIAEAFAATRSITVPTQLRSRLRSDGRDLAGTFRKLAPQRPPVAIQLWSWRRVAVTAGVVILTATTLAAFVLYVRVSGLA